MQKYEMSDNCGWYTPEAWAVKEGPSNFLEGAKLILWFENELYISLNYGDGVIADELQDLAGKFGYSYEQWVPGIWDSMKMKTISGSRNQTNTDLDSGVRFVPGKIPQIKQSTIQELVVKMQTDNFSLHGKQARQNLEAVAIRFNVVMQPQVATLDTDR